MSSPAHTSARRNPITQWWTKLNDAHPLIRVPIKLALFVTVLALVLFPNPSLLVRQVHRLADLEAMIDPHAPELEPLVAQLHGQTTTRPASPAEMRKRVQMLVCAVLPYDWDWEIWSAVDYVPTVAEALERGREDCDGRAVLAASLLRRLGQDAHLATDLRHVWVVVGKHELMSPGGRKSMVTSAKGQRIHWSSISNVPRMLAFGVAVFPLAREIVLAVTLVVLLADARMPRRTLLVGVLLLAGALLFLRMGVTIYPDFTGMTERVWASWLGLVLACAGVGMLVVSSVRARATCRKGPTNREAVDATVSPV